MKQITFALLAVCASALASGAPPQVPVPASAPTTAPARLDIAILHQEEKRLLLWPMLSIPTRAAMPRTVSLSCPDTSMQCTVAKPKVMRMLHMKTVPYQWFDADGGVFTTHDGYYANNLLGGAGDDFLGFTVYGKPQKGNIAVSNLPGVFAQKTQRKLANVQGIDYGKASIDRWRRDYLASCDNQCEPHIDTVSNPGKLAGTLTEYKLPSGLVLQHLDVSSFAYVDKQERKRKRDDRQYKVYLRQNLWRSIDQAGKATVLHAQPEMVYYDCDSQCLFTWDFVPDVFEYGKKILVIGSGRGGEVFGYYVFEFKKGKMEVLTAGIGGS